MYDSNCVADVGSDVDHSESAKSREELRCNSAEVLSVKQEVSA
jgi:hypothetical protein